MNTDELHNKLSEKGWLIDGLTEVDFLLIAHVKEIMEEQLRIGGVVKSLKGKHTQTFDEFMTGICKNRGITLINNYTKETVGFDTLIEKWKATNT